MKTQKSQLFLGWLAAWFLVLSTAVWQIATRLGAAHTLSPVDLNLLRYCVPALILLPVLWRTGLLPKELSKTRLAVLVGGAGLPFGLLAVSGAKLAPVAHMAAMLAGMGPITVMLAAWWWFGERPAGQKWLGAGLIVLGVGLVTQVFAVQTSATGLQTLWGDALFLAASCVWAAYTVALRGTSLSALQLCALVSGWSAMGAALLWLATPGTRLLSAPVGDVLLQVLVQGVVAGVMGITAYGYAVKILGTLTPSALGAFVPVVSALGGALLLGETLTGYALLGVCVVTLGVLAMQLKRKSG